MKLTKKDLAKLITEEINHQLGESHSWDSDMSVPEDDPEHAEPAQQLIDWLVAVEVAAKAALEKIEDGEDPAVAAASIDVQYEKRPRETNP